MCSVFIIRIHVFRFSEIIDNQLSDLPLFDLCSRHVHPRGLGLQLQSLVTNRLDADLCFTMGIHGITIPDVDVEREASTGKVSQPLKKR